MFCYLFVIFVGILEMICCYELFIEGKEVVVLGCSNIVGMFMSILFFCKGYFGNVMVIFCYFCIKDLVEYICCVDILVVAIGILEFVKLDMVKEGVVIIDVGINCVEVLEFEKGYWFCGDVDYEVVVEKAFWIIFVLGGVG